MTVQGNFEVRPADLTYGKSLSFLDGKVRVDLVPPFEQITNDPQGQNYCRFEGRVWVVWQAWRGGHALTDGCSQTYDVGAAPTLLEVTRDGVTIPAVAAVAKSGLLFILDRATGKPIFGAEERTVPRSDVPGEKSWPTQPFPLKPPPLARSSLTAAEGSRLDPESERFCRELLAKYPNKGPFTPFLTTGSSLFPGNLGGVNWGGLTFDQGSGLIYLAVSNVGAIGKMVPAAAGAKAPNGAPLMPYRNENAYARFVDQNQYPCNQPPWGELVAISANTADIVWRTPLGSYDELESKGVNSAGAVVLGGPFPQQADWFSSPERTMATSGHTIRRTGLLWSGKLDGSGDATPITYQSASGRQFVVIAVGGSGHMRSVGKPSEGAARVAAFSLPR